MKKWYTHIIMLVSVLFTACNMEETLFPEKECGKEDITVRIVLSMMDSRANTRAYDPPHTDNYEQALGNEYYINQYDVEVLVFNANGAFVERATLVQATGPTPDFHTYELTGTLSNIAEEKTYQMVVLANRSGSAYCTNFSNTITVGTSMTDVLQPLVYGNYTAAFTEDLLTEGSTERIPMWGVVKAELKDEATITVNMLRAMAKVRVNLDAEGYTLAGVTLNQANNGGYFTPTMDMGIKTDGSTKNVSEARIPLSGLTTLPNLLFVKEPGNTNSYVIYVPECNTFKEETRTATTWMTVSINDALGNTVDLGENNKLYFREYRETDTSTETKKGEYFDIVRNYFYDYTITGVSNGLDLTLAVVPWAKNEDMLDYTENTVGYNVTGNDYGWKNHYGFDKDDFKILYLNTGNNVAPATYKFLLMTPLNAEWKAVLNGSSNLEFVEGDGYSGELVESNGSNITVQGFNGSTYDGTVITLGVKAKDSNAVGQYSAILHFYVNLGNKWYEIDLVDGNESNGLNYWTIKHNKSSV